MIAKEYIHPFYAGGPVSGSDARPKISECEGYKKCFHITIWGMIYV